MKMPCEPFGAGAMLSVLGAKRASKGAWAEARVGLCSGRKMVRETSGCGVDLRLGGKAGRRMAG